MGGPYLECLAEAPRPQYLGTHGGGYCGHLGALHGCTGGHHAGFTGKTSRFPGQSRDADTGSSLPLSAAGKPVLCGTAPRRPTVDPLWRGGGPRASLPEASGHC